MYFIFSSLSLSLSLSLFLSLSLSLTPPPSLFLSHTLHTLHTRSFISSEEGGDALRALHAYCYMHRLFLEFLSKHPLLVSSAKDTIKAFIEDPAKRHIEVC